MALFTSQQDGIWDMASTWGLEPGDPHCWPNEVGDEVIVRHSVEVESVSDSELTRVDVEGWLYFRRTGPSRLTTREMWVHEGGHLDLGQEGDEVVGKASLVFGDGGQFVVEEGGRLTCYGALNLDAPVGVWASPGANAYQLVVDESVSAVWNVGDKLALWNDELLYGTVGRKDPGGVVWMSEPFELIPTSLVRVVPIERHVSIGSEIGPELELEREALVLLSLAGHIESAGCDWHGIFEMVIPDGSFWSGNVLRDSWTGLSPNRVPVFEREVMCNLVVGIFGGEVVHLNESELLGCNTGVRACECVYVSKSSFVGCASAIGWISKLLATECAFVDCSLPLNECVDLQCEDSVFAGCKTAVVDSSQGIYRGCEFGSLNGQHRPNEYFCGWGQGRYTDVKLEACRGSDESESASTGVLESFGAGSRWQKGRVSSEHWNEKWNQHWTATPQGYFENVTEPVRSGGGEYSLSVVSNALCTPQSPLNVFELPIYLEEGPSRLVVYVLSEVDLDSSGVWMELDAYSRAGGKRERLISSGGVTAGVWSPLFVEMVTPQAHTGIFRFRVGCECALHVDPSIDYLEEVS